jgi:hypothetical protein
VGNGVTYVVALELAASDLVQDIVHLGHGHHLRVAEDGLVDGLGIDDGLDDELSDIPGVGESRENVAIAGDGAGQLAVSHVVERGGQRELEPPADVDDGVWESEALDVVEDVLFLWELSACCDFDRCCRSCMAYRISQCHSALWRSDGGVEARQEPLDTGKLGGSRKWDLLASCGNADGGNDHLLSCKGLCGFFCRTCQIHNLCLYTTLSQSLDIRSLFGSRPDHGRDGL